MHSFDSFEGLPEDWRGDPLNRSWARKQFLSRGSFSRHGRPPFFESGIHWHVGWFNATLPAFLESHPRTPISLVHIDCDLYSSTASVLEALEPRLTDDAVLVFDELVNYPEYREHEARALVEFLRRTDRGYRVLGVGPSLVLPNETDILNTLMLARHLPHEKSMPFGPASQSNEDVAIQLMRGVR